MTEPEEDFAALFEASVKAARVERGDTIAGTIVAIGQDVAFVNVGGKGEAIVDLAELRDETGALEVAVGDRIQAMVVSTEGGLKLSRALARGAAGAREVEDAFRSGLPVEGKVEREIKGGYEVRVGRQRAFCPFSQIDIARTTTPADHLGHVYTFRIVEYQEGGRNLVVSRRAVLEEEQAARAAELRKTIVPGAILTGRVASVLGYGAFVDLGAGIQGLLHVSEMSWARVGDPAEIVKPGDEITVKVLRVDAATDRIALGLKQLADDPWSTVAAKYQTGQVVAGRVTRIAEFGAFVELEPGIEALAHVSTFPPTGRRGGWAEPLSLDLAVACEVLSVEPDKKRIGVALVPEGSSRAAAALAQQPEIVPGVRLTGKVERHERFGVFVFLAPGRTGLIPMSETGLDKEADLTRAFPPGSDIDVVVLEVDPEGRRVRLSRKAVLEAREAAEVQDYRSRADAPTSGGLGSLADKLRGALDTKNR